MIFKEYLPPGRYSFCVNLRFSLAERGRMWYNQGEENKLGFSGEFENAKCKMQNAKLMKPFADAKACLVVKVRE